MAKGKQYDFVIAQNYRGSYGWCLIENATGRVVIESTDEYDTFQDAFEVVQEVQTIAKRAGIVSKRVTSE